MGGITAPLQKLHAAQVDQPLCMECSAAVQAEVEAAVAEAEEECAAYQAALDELSRQEQQPLPTDVRLP